MLKLVKFPNIILNQKAEDWQFVSDEDYEAAKQTEIDMVKLMVESNGMGLAGNQVGLLKRVFAIHLTNQVPFCMFNPRVVSTSEDIQDGDEGCLSFPNLWLKVKRHKSITAEYFDRQGKKCIIELEGLDARCFLHELDHLNGTTFTKHVSDLKLKMAQKKQRKLNG